MSALQARPCASGTAGHIAGPGFEDILTHRQRFDIGISEALKAKDSRAELVSHILGARP